MDTGFDKYWRIQSRSLHRWIRSLKNSDLSKLGFHPELQREMTVAELVERMGGHGASHLKQIEELKAAARSNL